MMWLSSQDEKLIAFLKRELAPSSERWHATLRVLAASALALSVSQIFRLNQGYWAVVTILVICTPGIDSSVRKMLHRLMGTLAGVVFAYILTTVFWQQYWFFIAGLFASLMFAGLLIARSKEAYIGWVFALTLIVCTETSAPDFASVAGVCFERLFIVVIGVICSWIAIVLIYPIHPERECAKLLRKVLDDEIARAKWVSGHLRSGDEVNEEFLLPPVDPLQVKKMLMLCESAGMINQTVHNNRAALADRINVVASISSILSDSIALIKNNHHHAATGILAESAPQLIIALDSILHDLRAWAQRDKDLLTDLAEQPLNLTALKDALDAFAVAHERAIVSLGIREGTGQGNRGSEALLGIAAICRAFYTTYSVEHDAPSDSPTSHDILRALTTPMLAPGLSDDKARSWWFAIKLAIACVFGLIFVKATQMPSLGTMMITPVMIVLATGGSTTGTLARARLRFLGAALGGVVAIFAIIFLIPTAQHLHALLILWLVCCAPLVWIANGGPKFAYVGLQAVFCMAMAIGSPLEPSIDLAVPSARIVGVFLGALTTLAVFNFIAPEFARNELLRLFSLTLQNVGSLATMGLPTNPSNFSQIVDLRYQVLAVILRGRVLGSSLTEEPRSTEPTITQEQVVEITDHLTLLLSTTHAIALNRISAHLAAHNMTEDLKEQFACANAIQRACEIGCAAIASGNFEEFARTTDQLLHQTEALSQLIPEIRSRPNLRRMSAEPAQFIVGQIGMYRVAARRLADLSDILTRISADGTKFKRAKRRQSPLPELTQQPA